MARARPGSRGGARVRLRALGRQGVPSEIGGEELPLPARLLHVARDYSLFLSAADPDDARTVLERRAAQPTTRAWPSSPCATSTTCVPGWTTRGMWEHALECEPFPQVRLSGDGIDAGFAAFAALTGLKSPWLREHSTARRRARRGSRLATGAAGGDRRPLRRYGCGAPPLRQRLERDLGEARAARFRGMGTRSAASALHRARVRPVAGPRPDRSFLPAPTTSGSTVRATTGACADRGSTRRVASSPPRIATRRCARRGRTGRRSSPQLPRQS